MTRPGEAGRGQAWQGEARRGEVFQRAADLDVKDFPGRARRGKAGRGEARRGEARFFKGLPIWTLKIFPGAAWLGVAGPGQAGQGEARFFKGLPIWTLKIFPAWRGWARLGLARPGKARRGEVFNLIEKKETKKLKEVNVSKLILDYNLYPRREIDSQHVSYMVESLNAGVELPPVVADEKSKRVVDGFHRITAIKRLNKSSGIISVIYKKYKSDADIFVDAMRYNASHGRTLTQYDRTHCIIRGEELHIPKEILASALNLTTVKFGKLHTSRVGKLHSSLEKSSKISTRLIPLKRTIQHKTNSILTDTQEQANIKLSGMHQVFYVNQIILLIESDLLNTADEKLMNRIGVLHELLNKLDADKRIVKSK